MMRFAIRTVLAVGLLFALASTCQAQTMGRKFGRGLAAITTAFLEVPGNMVEQSDKHGSAEGIPLGFALGLGMIVPRVLVGVYEVITAPIAAPAGYRPLLKPEYPWGYFS